MLKNARLLTCFLFSVTGQTETFQEPSAYVKSAREESMQGKSLCKGRVYAREESMQGKSLCKGRVYAREESMQGKSGQGTLVIAGGAISKLSVGIFHEFAEHSYAEKAIIAVVPAASSSVAKQFTLAKSAFVDAGVSPENIHLLPLVVKEDRNTKISMKVPGVKMAIRVYENRRGDFLSGFNVKLLYWKRKFPAKYRLKT